MSLQSWVLAVLVLATAVALARVRAHRRDPRGCAPGAWPCCWRCSRCWPARCTALFPPQRAVDGHPGAADEGAGRATRHRPTAAIWPLPGPATSGKFRARPIWPPLRRHPGLPACGCWSAIARPRPRAARGLDIAFEPLPPTPGLVELQLPARVVRGAGFAVAGASRATGSAWSSCWIRPAVADAVAPDRRRFQLRGVAMEAGRRGSRCAWPTPGADPGAAGRRCGSRPTCRGCCCWPVRRPETLAPLAGGCRRAGGRTYRARRRPAPGHGGAGCRCVAQADLAVADARAWSGSARRRARAGSHGRCRPGAVAARGHRWARPHCATSTAPGSGWAAAAAAVWTLPPPRLDDEQALRADGQWPTDAPFDLEQARAAVPQLSRRDWRVQGAGGGPGSGRAGARRLVACEAVAAASACGRCSTPMCCRCTVARICAGLWNGRSRRLRAG